IRDATAALKEAQYRLVSAQQTLINLGLPIRIEDVKDLTPEALRRAMQFLGLPDFMVRSTDQATRLDPRTATSNLIPVKAPFAGVVISRKAVLGEMADPSKVLFVVADPRRMWLTLHIRQDDLKAFKHGDAEMLLLGRQIRFRPDGTNRQTVGVISWVAP